jgi:CubicO group peptidase (beta-lactamase class C family)
MNTTIGRFTGLALMGLGMAASGAAQSNPSFVHTERDTSAAAAITRGRFVMNAVLQRTGVPGMAVAVGFDGEVVWSEGFGSAGLELGVPATARTRFRSGVDSPGIRRLERSARWRSPLPAP